MKKNAEGAWIFLNREYCPLGSDEAADYTYHTIFIKYTGRNIDAILEKIAETNYCERDNDGEIKQLWFYDDGTNPMNRDLSMRKSLFKRYFLIIEKLCELKVKPLR